MMKIKLFILLSTVIISGTKKLDAEEFTVEWEHEKDWVNVSISAPTDGWVAIGFTEDESIISTNLIQGCVRENKVIIEDQFVTGFGKHPTVSELGVKSRIFNSSGSQNKGETTLRFSIYTAKKDQYHFDLSEGKKINVWLAFSVSDDFNHHSRKRILRTIEL